MALITHQTQGSYATFSLRPLSYTKQVKLSTFVAHQLVWRSDRSNLLNRRFYLSTRAQPILQTKVKRLKISAFKGSAQNDESGSRSRVSKFPKNSEKLSYVSHEDENTIAESLDIQDASLSYSSEGAEERVAGSPAIQKLFKKWLMLLQTQSSNQAADGIFSEEPPWSEISESQSGNCKQERVKILKAAWCYFLGLDVTIKIPLLIFIPLYLAVNGAYGTEVSKELTPLWIFGPLIVGLYIKMFQALCALYVFSFKQTTRILKNLPIYFLLAYNYVAQGKLKEDLWSCFWQPVVSFKKLDYKELSTRKLKELEEWAVEKYLDYVESIWPFYYRTIRFLKKANLI